MKRIRRNDIVFYGDGKEGKVLEVLTTSPSKIFKIQHLGDEQIDYFEESKVSLKIQRLENKLKDMVGLD